MQIPLNAVTSELRRRSLSVSVLLFLPPPDFAQSSSAGWTSLLERRLTLISETIARNLRANPSEEEKKTDIDFKENQLGCRVVMILSPLKERSRGKTRLLGFRSPVLLPSAAAQGTKTSALGRWGIPPSIISAA